MTNFLLRRFVKNHTETKEPSVRAGYAMLSGIVGVAVNLLLAAIKMVAGVLSASISITADALNNLSDAGTSIVSLFSVKLANAQADADHPFGHGRIEYLAAFIISVLITLMGFELGRTSIGKILAPEEMSFSVVSCVILLVSICMKLWLGFFNKNLGEKINSQPLKAVFADSISDVISTTAVLISLLVHFFFAINIDGIVGLCVSILILINGVKTAIDSFAPLLGTRPDDELVEGIISSVLAFEEVVGVHDLIVHNYGVGISIISLHAELPSDMSFSDAHEIADEIEIMLSKKYKCEATIHMDPIDVNDEFTNSLKKKVNVLACAIDRRLTIHDFRVTKGNNFNNLIFDVVVPYKFHISDEELACRLTEAIQTLDEKYRVKITVDKSKI